LKKIVDSNQRNWHLKLTEALWASKTTPKDSIGMSPYLLVYGKEEFFLINLEINALIFVVNTEDIEDTSLIHKKDQSTAEVGRGTKQGPKLNFSEAVERKEIF
jgi:hypothetical protein